MCRHGRGGTCVTCPPSPRGGWRARALVCFSILLDFFFRARTAAAGIFPLTFSPSRTPPQPLRSLKVDAQALATSIASTASLSERVSRKVRQLDVAQSRVNKTLTHITATVGRTEAVDGLRRALAADDFEAAATHIAQFRDLEARFVSGAAAAAADDRQMAEQHDAVGAARTQLATTIHARLEVASRVGDHDAVDRFIRLYKPLDMEVRVFGHALAGGGAGRGVARAGRAGGGGRRKRAARARPVCHAPNRRPFRHQKLTLPPLLPHTSPSQADGLAWFQAYLRKLVADRASEAYTALLEGAGQGAAGGAAFVDGLTGLFKDIVSALDANAGLVADTFGQPALLDVALALQEECDVHGARILQRYAQHRGLATLVQQTTMVHASPAKDGSGVAAAPPPAPVDPRQVEAYLEEILVLYQRSEEYNQYVLACMANAVAPDPLGGGRENAFRSGQFNITVRELVSSYINLVSEGRGGGCLERKLGGGGGAGEREKRGGGSVERREDWREGSARACELLFFFFKLRRTRAPSPPLLSPHALPSPPHPKFHSQEEYYLEQNVKKAIAIDEWSPGSLLSSMVDDVFFIVQKSCRRALATGNTQCACTVLGQGNGMLATQLRAALDARWKVNELKWGGVRRRRCVWMGVRRALSFSARP